MKENDKNDKDYEKIFGEKIAKYFEENLRNKYKLEKRL